MMVKSGAIEIIFKSHEPFQSYLLTGQADSAKKACLLGIQNEIQALQSRTGPEQGQNRVFPVQ